MSKKISWWQAAEILGISDRHMRRWRERYEVIGFRGFYRGSETLLINVTGSPLTISGSGAAYRDEHQQCWRSFRHRRCEQGAG
jgi:hypothetical protein